MFIKITTSDYLIIHGYDADNKEIIESVKVEKPMEKIVAVSRIQSLSEKYVLVTGSHGRLMYWEYLEGYDDIKQQLLSIK
jgi:hypothetical protein